MNTALTGFDIRAAMEEFDVELENWDELVRAGVNPPTKISFNIRNKSIWNKEYVQASWDWSKKLASHVDAEILFRILHLLRLSMIEDDEYDRLSKVWRGFNAFYNHLAGNPQSSEINRIRDFAKSLYAKNSNWLKKAIEKYWTPLPKSTSVKDYLTLVLTQGGYVSVMDCFVKQDFRDRRGTNHSQNLAVAVSAKDMMAALGCALLCVYVERNKVMHGVTISAQERGLLYVCAAFLQQIVAIGLNEFCFIPMRSSQLVTQ